MENSEKIGYAFPYFWNFSTFYWNKLYILGYMWIYGHCVELLKIIPDTAYDHNDVDQLYDWPTVIQLIQMYGAMYRHMGVYRCMQCIQAYEGVYRCMGTYRCRGVYRHGGVWTWVVYGHMGANGCMRCTDI